MAISVPDNIPQSMRSKAGEVRWLYVDFDSYFASCEQLLRPELRGKPIAVVPVLAETTCAIAASYEAKAYGVKTGTLIWEARKRCPSLILVPARHQLYTMLHEQAKEAIEQCHPITAVCSIDEIACHLGGRDTNPEAALALGREIKQSLLRNMGEALHGSIGIASNMFLAKIAADLDKPNGLSLLLPETLPGRLLELNITDLTGIGRAMEARLHRHGLRTMAQLWDLNVRQMKQLWGGIEGKRFWYKLHGYDLPAIESKRSSIGHSRVLDPALRRPELTRGVAQRLLLKTTSRLRRLGYCAGGIYLGARFVDGWRWGNKRRINASDDSFVFLPLLQSLWQELSQQHPRRNILKIGVTLYDLIETSKATGDLFSWKPRGRPTEKLSRAMDAVHKRFGREALTLGWETQQLANLGTKIAFTRVPDASEFEE